MDNEMRVSVHDLEDAPVVGKGPTFEFDLAFAGWAKSGERAFGLWVPEGDREAFWQTLDAEKLNVAIPRRLRASNA